MSFAKLIARAEALVPRLRERARDAEERRRLPDATVQELQDAGLFDVQKPVRWGGLELGLREFVELIAVLGRGCGSTAWVYGVTAERAWLAAKFALEAQEEIWGANPRALVTSSIQPIGTAMAVPGGYRVSGRWGFVSGIDIADWAVFCTNAPPEAGGGALYFLIPVAECEVLDTWHVSGLAATGSRDVKVTERFVPLHRTASVRELADGRGPGLAANPGPLFRLPVIAINPYAILAPALGIVEGTLADYVAASKQRRLVKSGAVLADQQLTQLRIATAAAEIDAARALTLADCDDAMRTAESGVDFTIDQRLRYRRNQGFAAKLLTAAVDRLFEGSGGKGIYLEQHVQRAFRDVHAATSHIGLSWDHVGTLWGQQAIGITPAGGY